MASPTADPRAAGRRRRAVVFDAYPHSYAGAQRVGVLIGVGARMHGWDVTVMAPGPGPLMQRAEQAGLAVEVVAAPKSLMGYGRTTTRWAAVRSVGDLARYWRQLAARLRSLEPEVVHVHDHRGMILAGVPARRSGARVVWHVHALSTSFVLNTVAGALAHHVIVPAASVLGKLRGLRRRHHRSVITYPLLRSDIAPAPVCEPPRILSVGRLHPDKGVDLLLRAVARAGDRLGDARVEIVGGRQEGWESWADGLFGLRGDLDLDDRVTFSGEVDDVGELLAGAALLVQSSREQTEILPLSIIEAMAAAVPVIATDVGGVADLVDETTGVLVTPGDVAALEAAMVSLVADRARMSRLGAAGRDRVHKECDPDEFVAAVMSVWDVGNRGDP